MTDRKILLIGGNESDRAALTEALEAAAFVVSAAITRRYTNRWLGRRIKPFDLIVYDVNEAAQPDEFWTELRTAAGSTPVIIITAPGDTRDYSALGFERVVPGPAEPGAIAGLARSLTP